MAMGLPTLTQQASMVQSDGDGWCGCVLGDSTQWSDSDGDGYGDNPPPATDGDACNKTLGTSYQDRFGCIDSDSDGYSDLIQQASMALYGLLQMVRMRFQARRANGGSRW